MTRLLTTLEDFETWLAQQPETAMFACSSKNSCPLAAFLKDGGEFPRRVSVSELGYTDSSGQRHDDSVPSWAAELMGLVDGSGNKNDYQIPVYKVRELIKGMR